MWKRIWGVPTLVLASAILAPVPTVAGTAPLVCDALQGVRSGESNARVLLKVVNATDEDVLLFWIDRDGERREYDRIKPGQASMRPTFETHAWVATTESGKCLCGLISDTSQKWTVGDQACRAGDPIYEPTASYHRQMIEGWPVLISSRLYGAEVDELRENTIEELRARLIEMSGRLPKAASTALQTTKIWLELDDPLHPGGAYHPSSRWLIDNGFNPEKVKSVQFSAVNFISWHKNQPAMVLHEFAHAFLDQFMGTDHPDLMFAFQRACKLGLYDDVERNNGRRERAYALNNQDEFFAELSEAYFWTNDFYPYDREQLSDYDPVSAGAIEWLWRGGGKPLQQQVDGQPEVTSACGRD